MTDHSFSRRSVLKKGAIATSALVLGGTAASGTAAAGIGDGRVGHYNLNNLHYNVDKGTKTKDHVHDASPEKNHGTWKGNNDDPVVDGAVGKGFQLENEGDYIRIDDPISISEDSDVTFAAWLNVEQWHGGNPGGWRSSENSQGNNAHFNIFQGETGLPWIRWNGKKILKPSDGYTLSPDDGWVHVTYVVRSDEDARFYADGDLKHSNNHDVETDEFNIYNIGWQYEEAQRIEGVYDEIRFYNRALSDAEITELYEMRD